MTGVVERIVQAALQQTRQTQYIPGGVVGVVLPEPGDVGAPHTAVLPFGVVDIRTGVPVDTETLFEIGSLTKLFTATLLAQAISDPALPVAIDSPLQDFSPVPVPAGGSAVITLAHLVSHRSGLPKMPGNAAHGAAERARYSPQDLWAAVQRTNLLFPPGFSWQYSNFGFGILGTILSELHGRPFGSLVTEGICLPLELGATALEPLDRAGSERRSWWHHRAAPAETVATATTAVVATGYQTGTTRHLPLVAPRWHNTGALAGSGGLVSTGADMTRFLAAATGYGAGPLAGALARIRQLLPAAGPQAKQMGMAWQVRGARTASPFLFKNGGTSGMHCAMAVRPRKSPGSPGIGVVVLTNGPDHVDDLAIGVLETLSAIP